MDTYQIIAVIFLFLGLIWGILKAFFDVKKRIATLETRFDDYIKKEIDKYADTVRDELRKETALLLSEERYRVDHKDLMNKIKELHELVVNRLFDK